MKLFVAAKGLVTHQGKALIMRESSVYDDGTNAGKYDVPGGRIDPTESLFDAFLREVKEESGLDVTITRVIDVAEKFQPIQNEECHVIRVYFHCESQHNNVKLSADHDAYEWIDPSTHTEYDLIADVHDTFEVFLKQTN